MAPRLRKRTPSSPARTIDLDLDFDAREVEEASHVLIGGKLYQQTRVAVDGLQYCLEFYTSGGIRLLTDEGIVLFKATTSGDNWISDYAAEKWGFIADIILQGVIQSSIISGTAQRYVNFDEVNNFQAVYKKEETKTSGRKTNSQLAEELERIKACFKDSEAELKNALDSNTKYRQDAKKNKSAYLKQTNALKKEIKDLEAELADYKITDPIYEVDMHRCSCEECIPSKADKKK